MDPFVVPGLLLAAIALVGLVVLRCVVEPRRLARTHADVAAARWTSTPPGPAHAPHAWHVTAYERWGYRVHDHGSVRMGAIVVPVTLLAHADGSVVDVVAGAGGASSSITSLLADGVRVVETMATQSTPSAPGRLIQVFPGAGPDDLVDRHREALAWLAAQGIGTARHPIGPVGVFEAPPRLLGLRPAPTVAEVRALVRGTQENVGPLAARPGVLDDRAPAGPVGPPA